jgi:uncharacterized protein (TIGR02996 family)
VWEPVALPKLPGRVLAVSEPLAERLVVWTTAGLFILKLGPRAELGKRIAPERGPERFDPADGCWRWRGMRYPMYGACGPGGSVVGTPLPTTQHLGQTLERAGDRLLIRDIAGAVRQVIEHCPPTDPWSAVGFNRKSGEYLLVAHPGSIRLFRFAGSPDGSGALWQRSGDPRERQALLRGILENPDDDGPRLVYADWLEEHGDPERAAFIRVQCRLAEREQFADVPYNDRDWNQGNQLREANRDRWVAELPALPGVFYGFGAVRRGFAQVDFGNPEGLVRHGERISVEMPIEAVSFKRLPPRFVARLLKTPFAERVCWLWVPRLPAGMETGLAAWLASPPAGRLRRVQVFDGCDNWEAVLRAVAASRYLGRLEKLEMGWSAHDPPDEKVVLALARSPHLPRLRFVTPREWRRYPNGTRAELRRRFPAIPLE